MACAPAPTPSPPVAGDSLPPLARGPLGSRGRAAQRARLKDEDSIVKRPLGS